MKKALLVTTVSGFVPQFEMNNVRILKEMGFEIHYASNFNIQSYIGDNHDLEKKGIVCHQVDFMRSPFNIKNLVAYCQLKKLMTDHHFNLVHCHTPMGGVIARLAAHATRTAPIIYTAHGFHFYAGAPFRNWMFYYPVELFLSRYTDQQICINHEDFKRAISHFHSRYIDYIPGVGIDLNRMAQMRTINPTEKKKQLGLPLDRVIFLSSGELIKRKNHETILRALAKFKKIRRDFQYVICGCGKLEDYLYQLAKELKITENVTFLGYRSDMLEIYRVADLFLFPSFQEGLPMAMLEAMASGLPILCSNIRGNRDLLEVFGGGDESSEVEVTEDKKLVCCPGGIMVRKANDADSYYKAIYILLSKPDRLLKMGNNNRLRAFNFRQQIVEKKMHEIYDRMNVRIDL